MPAKVEVLLKLGLLFALILVLVRAQVFCLIAFLVSAIFPIQIG